MSALGLHTPIPNQNMKLDGLEFVQSRQGSVLGQNTILKADHFPDIEHPHLQQPIPGAPNFRGVTNLPVYGVGMPSIDGIRKVLEAIGAGPQSMNSTCALWFNWREEPLVYINGNPFVLREHIRPFKNLKEYGDIDTKRLEKMEERLKNDIHCEVRHSIESTMQQCTYRHRLMTGKYLLHWRCNPIESKLVSLKINGKQ